MLVPVLLVSLVLCLPHAAALADRVPRSCGQCDPALCTPLPPEGCKFGSLPDACGCCSSCASGEGEPCGGRGPDSRRCAPGLECSRGERGERGKRSKAGSSSGVCVCRNAYEVCGSDGITYQTACELRAASVRAVARGELEVRVESKGKCGQAPVIVTNPGEIWNVTGSQVYLSCEATGVPTPVLTWKKLSETTGKAELLPGDRDNLAIQTRGGPEKHEVTGWVLILPLTKADGGSYQCHAANPKGVASAVGSIHVVDSMEDIPTKTAKDEEL
ncbi:insulin-like growth factor-binding protein 7 [Scleropages formosus]|uniref:Insulin-like growth factor binding protein 7 n=1 Tax=Scleropages formosus TaxID=113540 RepID=A0A8C9SSK7_SCLFO|nr:insulin-like growth factor-binding protein 7 [Scleropages formosus]